MQGIPVQAGQSACVGKGNQVVSGSVPHPPPGGGDSRSSVYAGEIPARRSGGLLPGLLQDQDAHTKWYIYDVLGCQGSTGLVLRRCVMAELKCTVHPKYKAIYQPRCDCQQCWKMYRQAQKK